jgi:hypothetical protein
MHALDSPEECKGTIGWFSMAKRWTQGGTCLDEDVSKRAVVQHTDSPRIH